MSEMVERVAMAMSVADKANDLWDVMSEDGDGYGYVGKNEYRVMAHAAIEAMREPTYRMLLRRQDVPLGVNDDRIVVYLEPAEAEKLWQAMVDEALK